MSDTKRPSKLVRVVRHASRIGAHLRRLPDTQLRNEKASQELKDAYLNLELKQDALNKDIQALKELQAQQLQHSEDVAQRTQSLDERLTDIVHQLTIINERGSSITADPAVPDIAPSDDSAALMANEHLLDQFYVHFERWFRGTEAEIKQLQQVYAPLFTESSIDSSQYPVLDIGCGNGEFVELLKEHGVRAIGLDLNKAMIERVNAKGLEGIQADALTYLRAQKSNSLMAITGFHIVEHVPFIDLLKLSDECYRVLRPEGFVIFETPNPENVIVGSCNFYNDPSHLHPLPPAFLELVMKTRGFLKTEIKRLHPLKPPVALENADPLVQEIAERMYGPQDYSVIAYK